MHSVRDRMHGEISSCTDATARFSASWSNCAKNTICASSGRRCCGIASSTATARQRSGAAASTAANVRWRLPGTLHNTSPPSIASLVTRPGMSSGGELPRPILSLTKPPPPRIAATRRPYASSSLWGGARNRGSCTLSSSASDGGDPTGPVCHATLYVFSPSTSRRLTTSLSPGSAPLGTATRTKSPSPASISSSVSPGAISAGTNAAPTSRAPRAAAGFSDPRFLKSPPSLGARLSVPTSFSGRPSLSPAPRRRMVAPNTRS
mmetsp:Transcript_2231/g.5521  ORF Transcript_2231/g.5521 Transcript_2231/m.5521 type:complete len:263 (+) Transcript_2231:508-1296(+)